MNKPIIEWAAIANSELWETQIEPWLDEFERDAAEDMGNGRKIEPDMSTLEAYRYWQGYRAAIKAVRNMPDDMVIAEREMSRLENEDNGKRDASRRDWLRGIRTALGR